MNPDIIGDKIARFLEGPVVRQILDRRRLLATTAATDAELAAASWTRMEVRQQATDVARITVARAEEGRREGTATDRDVADAKLALKREIEQTTATTIEVDAIQHKAAASKATADSTDRFLAGLQWPVERRSIEVPDPAIHRRPGQPLPNEPEGPVPDVHIVSPKLPEGDLRTIVANQRAAIERLREEIEDTMAAPDRLESAERRLPAMVEDLAKRGAPQLTGAGETGVRLAISGPKVDLRAEPVRSGSGAIPKGDDALAMLAWLAPDRVLEKLRADLHEAYAGIDLALDPHERQRRVRDLNRQILEAERVEAAAGWALIEAGDDSFRFRADTDPRAVLGVAA